jgi:hypothetical protein
VPLEVALFLSAPPETDLDTVAVAATAVRPRVASWLVFDRETRATPDGLAATARRVLSGLDPGARVAGGTDGWFVELNRHRPAAAELDRVSFALSPQVHLVDDATVVENLDSLAWIAESVRAFGAGRPLGISPVTLRPRSDPSPFDPRHHTGFDACWTTGLLAAAAAAGFESLTLFEATGAQGLVDGEAKGPLAGVLGEVSRAAGEAAVLATRSSSPAVRALALLAAGSIRVLLANLGSREERVTVSLNGRPTDAPRVSRALSLAPLAVACVSFDAEETTPVSRAQDSR